MTAGFSVKLDESEKHPVLYLSGEITTEAEDSLVPVYQNIPAESRDLVIMDFTEAEYINSSGIAVLIQLITGASERKHKIIFCGLSDHFSKILDIVGLTGFVQMHNTLAEALQSSPD